jgi:drug/metabolite transporter (DMT)-like permease
VIRFRLLPVLALMFNAMVWGLSWWPFRQLEGMGLHPLWSTALVYALSGTVIVLMRPHAIGHLARTPSLWLLMLASGATNAAFNWGMVIGDVVRVVLLFYLMPLWVVILARLVLHEPLTVRSGLRVVLALAGAVVVLKPEGGGVIPWPQSLGDWLGVAGGFAFALNNVLLKRAAEQRQPEEARMLAMFSGGVVVAAGLATLLGLQGSVAAPSPSGGWVVVALALSVCFLASNIALQYGASRLSANATSVVMLTEVVFASGSALALGSGTLTLRLVIGGGLILSAALLAAFEPARH